MRLRGRSIRRKIVVLLLVPLLSLVSIWAFATYITGRQAQELLNVVNTVDKVGDPAQDAAQALQRERRQVMVYLADPRGSEALSQLKEQQRDTDAQIAKLRANARAPGLRSNLTGTAHQRLDAMLDKLEGLKKVRKAEESTLTRGGAFQAYNALIDPCYTFLSALGGLDDVDLDKQGRALVGLVRAREYLSREDALMAAALASGKMTSGDRRAFSDRVAERNLTYETTLAELPAEERQVFDTYWNGTDGGTLRSYEDAVIAAGSRGTDGVVNSERWQSATSTVLTDLERMNFEARDRYEQRVQPDATKVLIQAGAAAVLGAAAVIASVIISFRVGRGLVRDLRTLRREAQEAAGVRLPSVMRRLAAGEAVDIETEAPKLEYSQDEAGQVGQAVNTLQRAAVEAAVKQADMRRGVSEVFVNLARRNQVLLHKQLSLLDHMERRTEDSDELADLFRLDHLTTRMRRHAEGLVILSGAAPSRQWRKPVQLMDVVRAAVAEVEDYERIEVRRLPRLAVDGGSVADLTHLIAELLENATVYSPPHTAVQVLGERVANGYTLEIHDRGLGMAADALLEANLRLAETPEFELSDTDRLGLFVVSRLAQRQGVRVSLQPSPYGGTTAVVLLPGRILTETSGHDEDRLERRPSGNGVSGTRLDALTRGPSAPGPSGTPRQPAALDGPVELEAPLGELEEGSGSGRESGREDANGGRRTPLHSAPGPALGGPRPGLEQHQQAEDDPGGSSRPSSSGEGAGGLAPLPRRRPRTPVLVADHGRTVGRDEEASETQEAEEADGTEERRDRRGRQDHSAEAGTGQGTTPSAGPAQSGTVSGLPRRVRQASLAPQLKQDSGDSAPGRGDQGPRPDDLADRDADEVRSRMASLQRGWQRGRLHNAGASGDEAAESAPGTTPEGDGR
ncbi:histidine kinase [Streptomyces abyssalis]|uniref:histidine kinase n=1 Tax=Streptomyces abyssalis TaxID=933944 RepID=A0A1E7JTZ6_9ACTN|nr:nitrate- and nitrite sensing domain-containing protein [Streptomyces abyssalis]OEU88911.1 histidine kinase [Streptomyces abyssalis]OEU93432.1 histidine kinase [Streptomyces abyssalis]OEV31280.1 histidine kinase [Streptomyces nanshensis]